MTIPNSDASLADVQNWFQAVITHPGGVLDEALANAVLLPSSQLSADERLAVYARAYWARLLECMREEFPVVRSALGDDSFDELAIDYLATVPSTSYTLERLGAAFPSHLATNSPEDDFSAAVVELTVLERTIGEVFDLPGGETLGYLQAADVAGVPPDKRGELRLGTLPTVRLLRFNFDMNTWFTELRNDAATANMPERQATFVALSRRGYVVRRHAISAVQHELLTALVSGQTLSAAIAMTLERFPAAVEELAESLERWFTEWAAAGFFRGLA